MSKTSAKIVKLKPKAAKPKTGQSPAPGGPSGACPICNKPADAAFQPFCSKRCADVDLGRWLSEGYRIPDRAVEGFGDGLGDGLGEGFDGEEDG